MGPVFEDSGEAGEAHPPPGAPDPEPRPHTVPLNRSEERSLSGLEHELRRSAPDLATEMSTLTAATAGRPGTAWGEADRVLRAVAIGVILLVLLPWQWLAVAVWLGLLLVGFPIAMVRAWRNATAHEGNAERNP